MITHVNSGIIVDYVLIMDNHHENLVYYNPTIKRCSHDGFTELCYYSKLCPKSFIIFPHGPFQPRGVFGEDCQPCRQRQSPYHRQGRQRQEPTATGLGKVLRLRRPNDSEMVGRMEDGWQKWECFIVQYFEAAGICDSFFGLTHHLRMVGNVSGFKSWISDRYRSIVMEVFRDGFNPTKIKYRSTSTKLNIVVLLLSKNAGSSRKNWRAEVTCIP